MKAIEASPKSIARILREHEFIIPEYQRKYSWETEECEQLWDDLSNFLDNTDSQQEKYFLGSIVVYPNQDNEKIWEVIDGQQRLTTLIMLIKILSNKLSSHTILHKIMYKEDPITGDITKEPRLTSMVQGQDEKESFMAILSGNADSLGKTNLFRNNYDQLNQSLSDWWHLKDPEQREKIINILQNNVVMLPIECASLDDALTLFETINNRGKQLSDADIFKAKIYNAVAADERDEFINRWNDLRWNDSEDDHEYLFRVYMHISRAKQDDTGKEMKLREYLMTNDLRDKKQLSANWRNIMETMECYRVAKRRYISDEALMQAYERIYRMILYYSHYQYIHYPIYVFLNKYTQRQEERSLLPPDMHKAYINLMNNTIRYFYIKRMVRKDCKNITYKVCADIFHERDYVAQYRNSITDDDMERFRAQLNIFDIERYKFGIVLLNTYLSLNSDAERIAYGDFLNQSKKIHIEHILPKNWNHYDGWTEASHARDINKIGNLIPLEAKRNIKASNEFFSRKQQEYKKSAVKDALALSQKMPATWYPEDVEKRQQESLTRLMNFFTKFDTVI